MDLRASVPRTCACSCLCYGTASFHSDAWCRSLKRKMDGSFTGPSFALNGAFARGEMEDEVSSLREALLSQQESIQELRVELEEERSAAASAATEAMSMILRLQREKAETQMESRQFKLFADEKMAHDQQELAALEDLVFKRDQAILALSCEVQAYRHRIISLGISISDAEPKTPEAAAAPGDQFGFSCFDYSSPRRAMPTDDAFVDLDKYPFGETPSEQLQKLEERIFQLERMPSSGQLSNTMEKKVVVGHSPPSSVHFRKFSFDSCGSGLEFSKGEEFPVTVDCTSDWGEKDDMIDRIYTVDTVYRDCVSMQNEEHRKKDVKNIDEEVDIRAFCMRLETLEAERETMRQSMLSMGADKKQGVLLKEIAQQRCKDATSEKKIVKKRSFLKRFSIILAIKCALVFAVQKWKAPRIR